MKKRVLSGMQPTGYLHLGHYLGVLHNFVELQEKYDCSFMIANWHSLTVFYGNYREAHGYVAPLLSDWLAAGLSPNKANLFLQSDVREHAELSLLLSMYTPVSWLQRNPTYKEKQENIDTDIDSHGFLGYPVLQAADILLYKADVVPIGEDQLPHLELSREIARRFNHLTESETFVIPEALLSKFPKVLGTDGRKMSKTYGNTLNLADSEEVLTQKLKTMKTDEARVRRTDPGNPERCPVYTYYEYFAIERKAEIDEACRSAGIGCIDCKKIVGGDLVAKLKPFREKKQELAGNDKLVTDILSAGAEKATAIASETMGEVKATIGMN